MLPIVGVSLEEALLGFGGDDTELHDKEVTLTTSDVTGSQTAIFEYDPQNEPTTGTPPGPWDGYSLFTIDLSGVKDDIAAMQAQIAALEDELEDCHDCRDAVVAAIQEYDPDYDPAEGECPAPKVGEIVDHAQDCDDCKAEVVAKLQEYDPNFDPQTCEDIVDKVDEIEEEAEKPPWYPFPPYDPDNPDPDRYDNILKVIGNDNLTDNDLNIIVKAMDTDASDPNRHNVFYGFYNSVDGSIIGMSQAWQSPRQGDYVGGFKMVDPTTGTYEFYYCYPDYWSPTGWTKVYYTETSQYLIGYGDPTHSYTVSKNS